MRKTISFLLALVTISSFLPFLAAAETDDIIDDPTVTTAENTDLQNETDSELPNDLTDDTQGESQSKPDDGSTGDATGDFDLPETNLQTVETFEYIPGDGTYVENHVLVQFKSQPQTGIMTYSSTLDALGVAYTEMRNLNPSVNANAGTGIRPMSASVEGHLYLLVLENSGANAVESALETLNANPIVEYAQPDYIYEYQKTPNDPGFKNQYAHSATNIRNAWAYTTGSKSVAVGIIDSGINAAHPDLTGNLWNNPTAGTAPYANDRHGYDFVNRAGGTPTDPGGHGTQVAGIVGAKGNNGQGIAGVCWDVGLVWLGVGSPSASRPNTTTSSLLIEAVNYANSRKIPILNNSYGNDIYDAAFRNAINNYFGLFIAAAGNNSRNNDSTPFYPANYNCPNILSVASTSSNNRLSSFSSYGNSVHIAAPGDRVATTSGNSGYKDEVGTSFSAPYVAGVAALMKSVNSSLTTAQLKSILISTSRKVLSSHSFGIVDAGAAVAQAYNAANGWRQSGNTWYYYINNVMQKNRWVESSGKWYYLKSDGKMAENEWITWNNQQYYLKSGGSMAIGWLKLGKTWYHLKSSGAMTRNAWVSSGNTWYYLKSDGRMAENEWITWKSQQYYMKSGGAMATNWLRLENMWYYFSSGGARITGWQKVNDKWYYLDPNSTPYKGVMVIGSRTINNIDYRFNPSGSMVIGWEKISGNWYFYKSGGAMAKNEWVLWNGYWYYLKADGKMATSADGVLNIGGVNYRFSSSGAWVR